MRKLFVSCLTLLVLLSAVSAGFVTLRPSGESGELDSASFLFDCSGETIFTFIDGTNAELIAELYGLEGLGGNAYLAPEGKAKQIAKLYPDFIASAEPNSVRTVCREGRDNAYEYYALGLSGAWAVTTGDSRITVAVLDTGISRTADFGGAKILAGYDAVTSQNYVASDVTGHGTKVAGIIAATAPDCTIMPVRVANGDSLIYSADLIKGLTYAANNGAKVINMSFCGYNYSYAEQQAISLCREKGCILVSAAGNDGLTKLAMTKNYPACYDGVISVGAIDSDGEICEFTQGVGVDLYAPGAGVTVLTDDGYITDSGTSFAAAYVSAAAALCVSVCIDNRLTPDEFDVLTSGYLQKDINIGHLVESSLCPIITGVKDGDVVYNSVSLYFNKGTATLDGEEIDDGETVIAQGNHSVVVTDGTHTTRISFRLIASQPEYTKIEIDGAVTFFYDGGIAFIDGTPYKSGQTVKDTGEHCFVLINDGRMQSETFNVKPQSLVWGISDGEVYKTPITAKIVGQALLDGKTVQGDVYIGAGRHTLESGDEVYSFAVQSNETQSARPSKTQFASNGNLLVCYETGSEAIDVAYISSPAASVNSPRIAKIDFCTFVSDRLAVVSGDTVYFYTSDSLLTKSPIYTDSAACGGTVTALASSGDDLYIAQGNAVYLLGETEAPLATLSFDVSGLYYNDGKLIAYDADSDDGTVAIIDLLLQTVTYTDLPVSLLGKNVFLQGEFIVCGRQVFREGSLICEIPQGNALCLIDTVAICTGGAFDIQSERTLSLYGDIQSAIYAGETLFLADEKYAYTISGPSLQYYGGYAPLGVQTLKSNDYTIFSADITSALQCNSGVYLTFAGQNKLYLLNDTLTEVCALPFETTGLFDCGGELYAAFGEPYIMKVSSGELLRISAPLTDAVFAKGKLYAVCGKVLTVIDLQTKVCTPYANISANAVAVINGNIVIGNKRKLSVYDESLSAPIYSLQCSDEIKSIFVKGSAVIAGNDLIIGTSVLQSGVGECIGYCHGYFVTNCGLYDSNDFAKASPYATSAVYASDTAFVYKDSISIRTYDFDDCGIGVYDGALCNSSAEISVNNGFIDGMPISGSTVITEGGAHSVYYSLPLSVIKRTDFSITPALGGIRFVTESLSLGVGQSYSLRVLFEPSGADAAELIFRSSDASYVTVDATGTLETLSPGTAEITAVTKDGRLSALCYVTVLDRTIDFGNDSGIKIDRINRIAYYLPLGMTSDALTALAGENTRVVDAHGNPVTGKICTGMVIELYEGERLCDSLTLSVCGDIDGDGASSASDLMLMVNMLRSTASQDSLATYSADVTMNGQLTNSDMTHLRAQLLYRTSFYGTSEAQSLPSGQAIKLQTAVVSGDNTLYVLIEYDGISGFNALTGRLTYDKSALDLTDVYCPDYRIEYRDSGRYVSFIVETRQQETVLQSACGIMLLRFDTSALVGTTAIELLGTEVTVNRKSYAVEDVTLQVAKASGITAVNALRSVDFDAPGEYYAEFATDALAALIETSGSVSGNLFGSKQSIDVTVTFGGETYIIHCKKAKQPTKDSVSTLASLTVSGYDIAFDPYTTQYRITLSRDDELPTVTATAESKYASVKTTVYEHYISIICTAENGMQTEYRVQIDYLSDESSTEQSVESPPEQSISEASEQEPVEEEPNYVPLVTALVAAALIILSVLMITLKKRK